MLDVCDIMLCLVLYCSFHQCNLFDFLANGNIKNVHFNSIYEGLLASTTELARQFILCGNMYPEEWGKGIKTDEKIAIVTQIIRK
jgi:hypothetical protein